jgi:hypothetical protein
MVELPLSHCGSQEDPAARPRCLPESEEIKIIHGAERFSSGSAYRRPSTPINLLRRLREHLEDVLRFHSEIIMAHQPPGLTASMVAETT